MIIHAYFTDGYLDWGLLYLKAFKYYHGEKYHMVLDTRNLQPRDIKQIHKIYSNITVNNNNMSLEHIARLTDIPLNSLIDMKNSLEQVGANNTNRTWKMIIAGDDRIKALRDLMNELPDNESVFHSDIDMYTRGRLDPFFSIIKKHDFTTRFRMYQRPNANDNRKILINIMGFTNNQYTREFLNRWVFHIDSVRPKDRERGFGQTSCYYAFRDMNNLYPNEIKWGDVHNDKLCGLAFDYPDGSKSDHIAWFANKRNKKPNIENCYRDFERIRRR
jgi:hypothetical protein